MTLRRFLDAAADGLLAIVDIVFAVLLGLAMFGCLLLALDLVFK